MLDDVGRVIRWLYLGRKSREKRERRTHGDGPVPALVERFTSTSLLALLDAASVSPTSGHRGPTIAWLFHTVAQRRHGGSERAGADQLVDLVAGAASALPEVSTLEDFCPYEGRSEVLVRWGSELFRLLPGPLERPTAMVGEQALLASVIDRVLIPRLGFGLTDVGEVILRRVDQVARTLAPRWPPGPAAGVGDDPSLTQGEVDAAAALPPLEDVLHECRHPDRAAAAAARFTVAARELRCDPQDPVSTFGAVIATRIRGKLVPLPTAFLIEAFSAIGRELAAVAAAANPRADQAFGTVVARRVARLFRGAGQSIGGPVRVGSGSIHSLMTFNGRLVLALDVAAGLTPEAIQARLETASRTLDRIRPGTEVQMATGTWRIPVDAKVVRAQVIAGPHLGVMLGSNHQMLTLEDLEWIRSSTLRSPEDLWYFVRDLARPAGVQEMFAWDLIDKWEVWRQQKSFYRGGLPLNFMSFAPHAAIAEWNHAVATAPTERALHTLGLAPLRDWPIMVPGQHRGTEVGDVHADEIWQVMSWPVPVGIAKTDPAASREQNTMLLRFVPGVVWKLHHSIDAFTVAAQQSGLRFLRIVFAFQQRDSGPALTVEDVADGVVTIGWDARLQAALAEDSFDVERLCGELIARVLTPAARDPFVAAWQAAPPGIRADSYQLRQLAHPLPDPLRPHAVVRNDMLRQLGQHLAASAIEPGTLDGADATQFESRTVFPWLVARFHDTINRVSADALLTFALTQLECVHHERLKLERDLGWQRGFPTQGKWGGAERLDRAARVTRAISFIVEEVLAHPPAGTDLVDDLAWIEALSVADLCIESCLRSAEIHHQLNRTSVKITDYFEIEIVDSDQLTDVDLVAYNGLRRQHMLPRAVPIATGQNTGPDQHEPARSMLDQLPKLQPIDDALRSTLGFGIDAITGVLNVATQWDADRSAPATLTSPAAVVDQCVELAVGATHDEYAAALDWLTLRGQDLAAATIPHWETERRDKRVATSPFIASRDGLWVLPWTAEATLRTVANYLSDGRLPRPAAALPDQVNQALNQYRQRQNREAEKECAANLSGSSLVIRPGVKPQKASQYGIPKLGGEIDVLCVDIARSRIWVIEVKDPYTAYSSYQLRRLINDFAAPGKYVDKLLAKVCDIEACTASLATALGIPDPTRSWDVIGLMATRHVEPAAFAVHPAVLFCLIADVHDVVNQDQVPAPGLHGPSTIVENEILTSSQHDQIDAA